MSTNISSELEQIKDILDNHFNGEPITNLRPLGTKPIADVTRIIKNILTVHFASSPANANEFDRWQDEDSAYVGKLLKDFEDTTDWAEYKARIATDIATGAIWLPYDENTMAVVFKYGASDGIYYYIPSTFTIKKIDLVGTSHKTWNALEKLVALIVAAETGNGAGD